MPVQDNEQPKMADDIFGNDEEKRRQDMQNSQENSTKKSQKLLPFLNAKAEIHQSRIDTINEKIAVREDKIARNEAKIEKLYAKADRLEDRNTILKNMLGSVPVVRKLIEKNEQRIANIRENKIPKRQDKIRNHKLKINRLTAKRDRVEHKLNRVLALNDTIRSFSIGHNKERREVFTNAMDRLNCANSDCLTDKLNTLKEQKNQLFVEYNDPNTSAVDKYDLQNKIDSVTGKIGTLEDKIHKLARPENHFAEQTNDIVDAAMQVTSEKISEAADNADFGMTELAETIFLSAEQVEKLDKAEITRIADKFNPLENVEVQLEDDANMIDGIINNGSKTELEALKKDLSETLDAMKEIKGNKYMMQSVREDVAEDIPKMEVQLEAVNKALEKFTSVVENRGIINSDYYNSLPKEQRHIESMSSRQAEKVIASLTAVGVPFSAVNRTNEKTAITVANKDIPVLKDMMLNAQRAMEEESRQAWHELGDAYVEAYEETHIPENVEVKKPEYQTVNPDFYKSLTKDNRSISVENKENADKVMERLAGKNIQFSAVIRKNDTVEITVAKTDENTYKSISDNVKNERAVQFVNPDFFKALPKEERATQRMSQENAEQKIAELSEKNIPHSAILNGNKSAITVEKKNVGAAFFSRDKLKRSAQRISHKSKQQDKPKTPNQNQGLE